MSTRRGPSSSGAVTTLTDSTPALAPATSLPAWRRVLAVVAHPDDESFGLGAVLAAFSAAGARTAVLCFTHGEASTPHGVPGQLHQVRARELDAAAAALGVSLTTLLRYRDGSLAGECPTRLTGEVLDATRAAQADGLLVFDSSGVTGHPDHAAATAAALAAADVLDLPVVAWTLPAHVAETLNAERGTSFTGRLPDELACVIEVDRARQRIAAAAHASQALPTSVLWRRLELLGDREHLRLLRPTSPAESPGRLRGYGYRRGYRK
jgi:LmbE family N-acetylglucosaminyl deacetylase